MPVDVVSIRWRCKVGEDDRSIGQALVASGIVTDKQLREALEYQKSIGGRLGRILMKLGYVKEETLLRFMAEQQGLELVSLKDYKPQARLMRLSAADFWEKHGVLPVSLEGSVLKVAMGDAGDIPAIDELRFATSLTVVPVLASPSDIQTVLNKYYYAGAPPEHRARPQSDVHELARKIGARGAVKPADVAVKELTAGADPARLARALAVLLARKELVTPDELAALLEELA